MQQQPFRAHGVGVEDAALLIRADVHALHKDLSVPDLRVTLTQVHPALAERLNLGAFQFDAAFVGFFHKIVVAGTAVLCHGFDAFGLCHASTPSLWHPDYTMFCRLGTSVPGFERAPTRDDSAVWSLRFYAQVVKLGYMERGAHLRDMLVFINGQSHQFFVPW